MDTNSPQFKKVAATVLVILILAFSVIVFLIVSKKSSQESDVSKNQDGALKESSNG